MTGNAFIKKEIERVSWKERVFHLDETKAIPNGEFHCTHTKSATSDFV